MAENKWDHFGEQIKNTVDQAIREGDFSNLSRSVGDIINNTVDSVKESVKNTRPKQAQGPYPLKQPYQEAAARRRPGPQANTAPVLYQRMPQGRVAGILLAVAGYAGMVIFGIVLLAFFIFGTLTGFVPTAVLIVFGILTVFCLGLGIGGSRKLGFISRFRGYVRMIGSQLYEDRTYGRHL